MRLKLFREKLAFEIEQADSLLQDEYLDQRIQAHIFCIAALLRKITDRVQNSGNIEVPITVRPNPTSPRQSGTINLNSLNNKFVHYFDFHPNVMYPNDKESTILLVSDKDTDVSRRMLDVREFLAVSTRLSEASDEILHGVVRYTITKLFHVSNAPVETDTLPYIEAYESLMDVFDLVRELGMEDWKIGNVAAFGEERNAADNTIALTGMSCHEIPCRSLFEKLFSDWTYIPFAQFQEYSHADFGKGLQGKRVIEIHPNGSEELPDTIMVRLDDILDILQEMKQELGCRLSEGP